MSLKKGLAGLVEIRLTFQPHRYGVEEVGTELGRRPHSHPARNWVEDPTPTQHSCASGNCTADQKKEVWIGVLLMTIFMRKAGTNTIHSTSLGLELYRFEQPKGEMAIFLLESPSFLACLLEKARNCQLYTVRKPDYTVRRLLTSLMVDIQATECRIRYILVLSWQVRRGTPGELR